MLIELIMYVTPSIQICGHKFGHIWSITPSKKSHEKEKNSKGNLSVWESSKPLNNPLVSTKIAYEAQFLRYFIFLKNSVGKKEN